MKRKAFVIFFFALFLFSAFQKAEAQCSICTKTAQQLGEKPGQGLNGGIIYLAVTPLAIFGIIGYRWWKHNREP